MALSSRYQHELSPGGLDAVRLQNDRVELVIVPRAGGKILDLNDLICDMATTGTSARYRFERRWSLTVEMQA